MNQEPENELRSKIQSLSAPRAEPAFRERVRREFIRSSIVPLAEPTITRTPRKGWVLAGAGLAAAAALLIALLLPGGPRWMVTALEGAAPVEVNGISMAPNELVGAELKPGVRLRTGPGTLLTIGVAREVTLVISENASLTLPDRTNEPAGEVLHASIDQGTAWGTTLAEFPSGGLWLDTPDARVRIRGTTFAVLRTPETTCVCVLEGTVEVDPVGSVDPQSIPVPAENRLFVGPGEPARLEILPQDQRDHLIRIRAQILNAAP